MPDIETEVKHAFASEEARINREACGDLFKPKPTQKEVIYDFIKGRGRVLTHELNTFGVAYNINNPGGRARELKAEGKIWRIHPDKMIFIYGKELREEAWSCWEADK